jgi:hypothetical protein
MTTAERAEVQARFNVHGGLLLATDAASEGLNLQQRCRVVVCYELPWNPARLEQRIGRVDRIGQCRRVHAITLVARDTAEDLVIARLARRLARVAATLGERDRLAAFLTDARTAGIVIAGAPEQPHEPTPLPRVTMGPATTSAAVDEAHRLSKHMIDAITRSDGCVRVSSIRATSTLPEGFLLAFVWFAIAGDGRTVDSHPVLVHVRADHVKRPRRAADARDAASAAIRRYEHDAFKAIAPILAMRLAHARTAHAAIVDRAIARERELRDWNTSRAEIQPGLFDRRAVTRADDDSAARLRVRVDHERRIAALARARALTPQLDLTGVLLVYGRT